MCPTWSPPHYDPASAAELEDILDAAVEFSLRAGHVVMRHFGGVVPHEEKRDGTPVTIADREAEELLRGLIAERFPGHGVLGEEMGESGAGGRVRWILDPIDGTRSFMRGVPLFGVLIGVEVAGEPVAGVAHFPALDETVSAGRGTGCHLNGVSCSVSKVDGLSDALALTTDVADILGRPEGAGWLEIQRRAGASRTWGDCYGHALVATGRADVMVDPVLSAWDAAPLLTIVTEAGGAFTDLTGEPTIHGGSGVSTNGLLHEEVLELLRRSVANESPT